ncbi:unnamed protein product, partial [Ixodes hexagonus]
DTPPRQKPSRSKPKTMHVQDEESEYIYTLEDTDDDRTQDSSDPSQSSSTVHQHWIYMMVAVAVVASAFLGVVMKFSFNPDHTGHHHEGQKEDRKVFIEPNLGDASPDPTTSPSDHPENSVTGVPVRRTTFTYECRTDACMWQSRLIYDKLNRSIAPCEDFHAYVCSNRWYADDLDMQERPYTVSGPGLLILDVAKYLLRQKDKPADSQPEFIKLSAAFLRGCTLKADVSKSVPTWERVSGILDTLSLVGWPFLTDPEGVNFQKVLIEVDKTMAIFPVVSVSLRKRFENEGYMLHLDAPNLVLVRHQITYLEQGMENYKKLIKRSLSLLGSRVDMDHTADDILQLERKLDEASAPPRKFVSVLNSTVPIVNLKRTGKLEWSTYLTYLQPGSNKVIVMNAAYVDKLSGILTSTALSTLLNYVGFRILVFLSPLLPKEAGFLVPLSYDNHIPTYNTRLQACVHLLEGLYPYGIRKIARLSMEKAALEKVIYDHNLDNLVRTVKDAMIHTVAHAPWLTQTEADIATRKIHSLEVNFIGAKEHIGTLWPNLSRYYDIQVEANFTANSTLGDYLSLLNESRARYWRSRDNADFDARHHVSSLRPGFEYNAGKNSLYIPYGVVAFQHRVSQSAVPAILMPFIVPYLVQGMYEAVDVSGSTMNARGMPESWWSGESLVRYRKLQRCFVESYLEHMQRFGAFQGSPMVPFIRKMMAGNAALQPSLDAYSRVLAEPHSMQRNFRVPGLPEMTPDMLFFVNFAASHCDTVSSGRGLGVLARRQVQHRVVLPSVLRVNLPLRNFDRFAEVFHCVKGITYMNPGAKCRLW